MYIKILHTILLIFIATWALAMDNAKSSPFLVLQAVFSVPKDYVPGNSPAFQRGPAAAVPLPDVLSKSEETRSQVQLVHWFCPYPPWWFVDLFLCQSCLGQVLELKSDKDLQTPGEKRMGVKALDFTHPIWNLMEFICIRDCRVTDPFPRRIPWNG